MENFLNIFQNFTKVKKIKTENIEYQEFYKKIKVLLLLNSIKNH